jgi:hypothetical protein
MARLLHVLVLVAATTVGVPDATLTFSPPKLITGEFSSLGTTSVRPSSGKGGWIVKVLRCSREP